MEEFKKLLIEYKMIIDLAYDKGSSRDYTADYMTYDFRGFIEIIEHNVHDVQFMNDQIKEYMPQLKEAVKHARKYKKWLTSEYNYTFG